MKPAGDLHRVVVHMYGLFRIETPNGTNIAPRSMKAQGLLALLCVAPDHARARSWLQDKLWSDRGREQGATSLRQALAEIRNALGAEWKTLLQSDRRTVQLDTHMFEIAPRDKDAALEFLEGLDVRDPEFEDWLRLERHNRDTRPPSATILQAPPVVQSNITPDIIVLPMKDGEPFDQLFSEIVASEIGTYLLDAFGLRVLAANDLSMAGKKLVIRCRCATDAGQSLVFVSCQEGVNGPSIWSGNRSLTTANGAPPVQDIGLAQLVHDASEAVVECIASRSANTVQAQFTRDLREIKADIFSLDKARLEQAEARLKVITDADYHDCVTAWRIFLRVIMLMERLSDDPPGLRKDLERLVADAEMRPPGALLLSAVSYAQSMALMNIPSAAEAARRALAVNPANPLAWFASSLVNVHLGETAKSFNCIMRARAIEALTPRRHWWDGMAAISAAAAGDYGTATQLAQSSHALAPEFKMPMRYLIALHARNDNAEGAIVVAHNLTAVEPDFSIERLRRDDSYPAATLRRTGVLRDGVIRDIN